MCAKRRKFCGGVVHFTLTHKFFLFRAQIQHIDRSHLEGSKRVLMENLGLVRRGNQRIHRALCMLDDKRAHDEFLHSGEHQTGAKTQHKQRRAI